MPRVIARSGHTGRMLAGCRCGRYAATAGALGATDETNRNATGALRRRAHVRRKLRSGSRLSGKTGPHRGAVSGRRLGRHRDPRRHPEAEHSWGSRSSSRTRPAAARRSAPKPSRSPRPTATPCSRPGWKPLPSRRSCTPLSYDPDQDFTPVNGLGLEPVPGRAGIFRSQERPRSDRQAKAKPGDLQYGTIGSAVRATSTWCCSRAWRA